MSGNVCRNAESSVRAAIAIKIQTSTSTVAIEVHQRTWYLVQNTLYCERGRRAAKTPSRVLRFTSAAEVTSA